MTEEAALLAAIHAALAALSAAALAWCRDAAAAPEGVPA